MSSQYRVSRNPNQSSIVDQEGAADIVAGKHCYSLELQFYAEVTVRFLVKFPPQAADNVHIDGLATLLAA